MNPYIINWGILQVRWYSLILLLAIGVAFVIINREAKREQMPRLFLENLFFYTILTSFLGARLYYVVFNWSYYQINFWEIFQIWNGGLAIHGGLISGMLFVIWYSLKHAKSPLKIFDMIVPGLLVAQIIGRFGNFFNSEAYGKVVEKSTLIALKIPEFIINGMKINGVYHHPTFLYESIWNLIGLIVIYFNKRFFKLKVGTITMFYLLWYGLGRFMIEGMRNDSLLWNNVRVAQLVSLVMVVAAILGYIILRNTTRKYYNYKMNEEANK